MAIEFYKIHTMDGVLTYVFKALFNMSFDKKGDCLLLRMTLHILVR